MNNDTFDVIVIGAGPSGLAAAASAGNRGLDVCVLERNDQPARKIYATGNGRCNYSNLSAPHSEEVMDAMRTEFGFEPAVEDGRVYPRSFEAASAAELLISAVKRAHVKIFCQSRAADVQKNAQGFIVECEGGKKYRSSALILACGGKAGIQYGCTGDGYGIAQKLGHSIVKPIPALDGLCCAQDLQSLHGVRLRAEVKLEISENGGEYVTAAKNKGEVQFTKNGISGICVMDLSRYVRLGENRRFRLLTDAFPEWNVEELTALLLRRKKDLGCGLTGMLPEKLTEYLHVLCPAENRNPAGMALTAKALHFDITGTRGWKTAQVTCGGVPLEEIDDKTFESLKVPGLYIVGELTDYDGPCGGYNLNYALYSGLCAGRAVLV